MPFNDSSPLVSTLVIGLVLGGLVLQQLMPDSRVGDVMWWVGMGLVVLFLASVLLGAVQDARAKRRVRSALLGLAAMRKADSAEEAARLLRIVEEGYVDRAVLDSIEGLPEAAARPGPQRIPVLTLGLRHGWAGSEPWHGLVLAAEQELRGTGLADADLERLDHWVELDAALRRGTS
ncbi:MAG TPA: hypothetical protein VML54_08135 [Candidatus Limnocylindrales bacterium]|nr:hypothetical protein [Candidatus Limnocylindrales bacterium]